MTKKKEVPTTTISNSIFSMVGTQHTAESMQAIIAMANACADTASALKAIAEAMRGSPAELNGPLFKIG